ncbi:MAG: helix-turn-helix transcriptional regulator [Microbacteriaceae bacterium]
MTTKYERFNQLVGAQLKLEISLSKRPIVEVRDAIEIDHSTLYRYLNGARPIPVSVVAKIADELGVPADSIIKMARLKLEDELSRGNVTPLRKNSEPDYESLSEAAYIESDEPGFPEEP